MGKLFSLCLMIGVTMQAADLAGLYVLQGVREVGSELSLKPDGSFEFMFAYGASDYWGKGTWRAEKDSVILTSKPGTRAAPFRLLSSSAVRPDGVRVHVVGPRGAKVPNIEVRVTGAKGPVAGRTDSEGIASFEDATSVTAVEFQIPEMQFEAGPYTVNPAHHDYTFEINGEAITEMEFKDEKLTIDGNAVVMHQFNGHPFEMRYVKQ
ncbi:MAG TPA: hypothetical protein VGL53_07815 [Bryobacteraceae bacterium]|jgi:hypothetical protein